MIIRWTKWIGLLGVWMVGTGMDGHDHGTPVEATDPVPVIAINAMPDAKSGFNLSITATNFRFTPESVNGDHVPGEGHGHLYVDGIKTARLYGPWFHVAGLEPGEHTLSVTLNANDHRVYAHNGVSISDTVTVSVPGEIDLTGYRIIDLAIVHRTITDEQKTPRVTQGDRVALRWTTDEATLVHLHGYDIEKHLTPGRESLMILDAHATGRFPITHHGFDGEEDSETTLTYLEVYPD